MTQARKSAAWFAWGYPRDHAALSQISEGRRKPRTLEFYDSLGRLYILPALGNVPVAKVTYRDVAQLHSGLREKPVTANRVGGLVRSFFYWLSKRGNVTGENPVKNLDWFPEVARDRFLTVEEVSQLEEALRIAEGVGLPPAPKHKKKPGTKGAKNAGMFTSKIIPANPVAVSALRFLIFIGWWEQEALTLKWSEVNLETGFVTLGDTKTGKSVRAIGKPALTLLASQPHVNDSPYVSPVVTRNTRYARPSASGTAVRCSANLEGVRLHDLRHSVASFAGANNFSLFMIGKLLGHKSARSTERYAHIADDARKVMADTVSEGIVRRWNRLRFLRVGYLGAERAQYRTAEPANRVSSQAGAKYRPASYVRRSLLREPSNWESLI